MILLIQLLSLLHYVTSDMEPIEYDPLEVDGDNILVGALWAMGVCSCVNFVNQYRNKSPIQITQVKQYDNENDFYITQKEGHDLQKLKDNIDELKIAIDHLIIKENVKYKGNKINNGVPIENTFGEGKIQCKKGDKYYHGTTEDNMKRWIKGDGSLHRFFERVDGKVAKWSIATNDHNQYCKNCSYDEENSKKRTVYKIYKCNGHEL